MNATEEEVKEEKIQQDFLWALGPKVTHQLTRSVDRTEPDKIKSHKLIKLYNRDYLPKRNKKNWRRDFLSQEDHCEKFIELKKEGDFPDFSTKLLVS